MKHVFIVILVWLSAPSWAQVTVTDYLGRELTLERPAERIVALAPHIVENIFSAGAGERIVGAVDYCDFPEAAKSIPRVGAISAFSVEAIVALKPDLVVVWHSGRGGNVMAQLVALGINVYASDPRTLEDVAKSIRDYAILTGNQAEGFPAALEFERRLKTLRQTHAEQAPVGVLYQVWNDPIQTLNDHHIISDVVRLCGGVNVFGDSPAVAPKISVESVLARNPAVIIASGMGNERPEWLEDWKRWTAIKAVANKHLYFVPPDLIQRHTVRILEGAESMCHHIAKAR